MYLSIQDSVSHGIAPIPYGSSCIDGKICNGNLLFGHIGMISSIQNSFNVASETWVLFLLDVVLLFLTKRKIRRLHYLF